MEPQIISRLQQTFEESNKVGLRFIRKFKGPRTQNNQNNFEKRITKSEYLCKSLSSRFTIKLHQTYFYCILDRLITRIESINRPRLIQWIINQVRSLRKGKSNYTETGQICGMIILILTALHTQKSIKDGSQT